MRRPISTSPLYEDNFDNEADSLRYQTGVQRGQIRRKIEELPDIRTLDELVQRRIQEAKLQFCSGLILAVSKVLDSPLFEGIMECEFPRKFSDPTFDYYFGASD